MKIGEVPLSSLKQRRANFRKMRPEVFDSLKEAIKHVGFQSLIVVQEGQEKDTFDVIDGHHRWQALSALNHKTAPVVILPKNATNADLAMLSFNLNAEVLPDAYFDLVRSVQKDLGEAITASQTGLNEDFLRSLNEEVKKTELPSFEKGSEAPASNTKRKRDTVKSWDAHVDQKTRTLLQQVAQQVPKNALNTALQNLLRNLLLESLD